MKNGKNAIIKDELWEIDVYRKHLINNSLSVVLYYNPKEGESLAKT